MKLVLIETEKEFIRPCVSFSKLRCRLKVEVWHHDDALQYCVRLNWDDRDDRDDNYEVGRDGR